MKPIYTCDKTHENIDFNTIILILNFNIIFSYVDIR